jgi:phenylpropionate dioxygenase-like ring-hydroxylating dioxygenase large terminal subunit
MDHALQCQLVRRVLEHLERKTTDSASAPSFESVASYTANHEREVATLFRKLPLAIGHASQVPNPGDFFTHDLSGVPLLVVRERDGELAGFLNVCRHRGTRLEMAPCGEAKKAFTCPYHAWSYALDGKLLHVPHERGFDRTQSRDLVRVPLRAIAGLIFVAPSPDAHAVGDWLGPLAADLDGFGLTTSHVYAPQSQTRALGWQLAIDVFLESYHLQSAHRDSIYPMFFDNLGLVDPSGPHLRNVFPKRSIKTLAERPEAEWKLRTHANVLFHLFPNTLILVEPDHAAVLHLWPQGPGHSLLQSYTLIPEPAVTDKARTYWDKNNAILYNAIAEDFALGESIQRGLASGANREFAFGAFEHALEHFHRQIRNYAV